jgi:putative nucleotidyltransferase with HDIG domain
MNTTNPSTVDSAEKAVFIFDAAEGMVLSKDVISSDGHLIAAKDTTLTLDIISKISERNILEITIYDEVVSESLLKTADSEQFTYYEKVRNSKIFQKFNRTYLDNIDEVKDSLNDIVMNNAHIVPEKLLEGTSAILKEYTNSLQVFDMLHSMREFDDLTYVHCVNVAIIASIIGKWKNLPQEDIDVLTLCGLLHDIGKLLVPNEILTKPDRLTANEYAIMKEHVNLGYQIVKDEDIDDRIKSAVLLHHEKCDGSGYPFGLKSENIPAFAKIITLADIYDAMTATRVYREALCPFTVIRTLEEDAFTKFDPSFSIPFLKNVGSSYIGNSVRLSDGRLGEVVMLNERSLGRPVVRCEDDQFIDLSANHNIEITAIL